MTLTLPPGGQLVLDFDGVLCDSATECLHIIWPAHKGFGVEAFGAGAERYAVPADIAARYWRTRPYMRHMAHFLVPLLDGPAPVDRAEFAQRFASLPEGMADDFARAAGVYRAAVRARRRDTWLALHGVWPQVCALVDGAYIATARDRAAVLDILGAHGVRPDPARIFDELVDKPAALAEIAERESIAPSEVWLLDDSIDNCIAVRDAGFGAGWASWGCGDPGDKALAIAHCIPVIALDNLKQPAAAPITR